MKGAVNGRGDVAPETGSGRRVDEKRLSLILARALEIEARGRQSAEVSEGYSLTEAETIAREAGISAESFRRAVVELESEHDKGGWIRRLAGDVRPAARIFSEKVPSEEKLEEILDALGGIVRWRGNGIVRRRGLRWSSDGYEMQRSGRALDISVTPSGDGTDISAEYDLRNAAGGIFGGICGGIGVGGGLGIGLGVGLGAMASPAFAVIFSVAGFLGSYFLARGIFSAISRRSRAEAERIAGLIAGLIEDKDSPALPGDWAKVEPPNPMSD